MLETLRNLTGGKATQKHADELEKLIATAREERSALSEMLNSLTTRAAKLQPMSKSLETMTEKAAAATAKLDEIAKRLSLLDERTKERVIIKPGGLLIAEMSKLRLSILRRVRREVHERFLEQTAL